MSRIKFFKVAYSKKDGRPVNDVVAQALSDMDELVSQMLESSMQSSSTIDEVFTQVMDGSDLDMLEHMVLDHLGEMYLDIKNQKRCKQCSPK
ncbi:unnamed protein product [Ilex paraguariensis]|uniref:Uncharacterized protein n=1 Tax=Ilex paraguariensis TaxID=185542 RepID=A0ABC8ULI1_9AQUA